MRIACLHTAESNISVFETASRALELDSVHLEHEVRADLLARAEQAGGLTEAGETATVSALHAMSQNAEAVLLTCSTLGPSVAQSSIDLSGAGAEGRSGSRGACRRQRRDDHCPVRG